MRNIAVMYGGDSVESDVSVITGSLVLNSINLQEYKAYPIYIRDGKLWLVDSRIAGEVSTYLDGIGKGMSEVYLVGKSLYRRCRFKDAKVTDIDCALLATHGGYGENGGLQGMLDMNGIPYTSSGVLASAICMDKDFTHRVTQGIGIGTVDYHTVTADMSASYIESLFERLGGKAVVKPNSLGSSIGIRLVENIKDLHSAFATAFRYDDKVLLERCVENLVEMNCAVAEREDGLTVSRVDVIGRCDGIYGFDEKYLSGRSGVAPDVPGNIIDNVSRWTVEIYQRLEMSGVVRVDYMYDSESGKLYLNEVNTIPGSLAYYLFESEGIDMTDLITSLIETAVRRGERRDNIVRRFSSSILTLRENNTSKLLQKIRK